MTDPQRTPGGALQRLVEGRSVHAPDGELRRATWLELFFDLVFVAAIANLGVLLHDDHTLGGVAIFAGLLAAVWWRGSLVLRGPVRR